MIKAVGLERGWAGAPWHRIRSPETKLECGQVAFDVGQDSSVGRGQSSRQVVLGKLGICLQKNEVGPLTLNEN